MERMAGEMSGQQNRGCRTEAHAQRGRRPGPLQKLVRVSHGCGAVSQPECRWEEVCLMCSSLWVCTAPGCPACCAQSIPDPLEDPVTDNLIPTTQLRDHYRVAH